MFRLLWWCCIYFIYNISAASLFVSSPLRHPLIYFFPSAWFILSLLASKLGLPHFTSIKERIIIQILGVRYRKKKLLETCGIFKKHISYLFFTRKYPNSVCYGNVCAWLSLQSLLHVIFKDFQSRKVQCRWGEAIGNNGSGPQICLRGGVPTSNFTCFTTGRCEM